MCSLGMASRSRINLWEIPVGKTYRLYRALHSHSIFILYIKRVKYITNHVVYAHKTDIKPNPLKCSYNRLLMTIDRPLLHGGATNACATTTISMPPR